MSYSSQAEHVSEASHPAPWLLCTRTGDSFVTNGIRLSLKNLYFLKTKKFPLRDRVPGLDIAEHSLRDVFNDVSKYIGNISISLNAVFP